MSMGATSSHPKLPHKLHLVEGLGVGQTENDGVTVGISDRKCTLGVQECSMYLRALQAQDRNGTVAVS